MQLRVTYHILFHVAFDVDNECRANGDGYCRLQRVSVFPPPSIPLAFHSPSSTDGTSSFFCSSHSPTHSTQIHSTDGALPSSTTSIRCAWLGYTTISETPRVCGECYFSSAVRTSFPPCLFTSHSFSLLPFPVFLRFLSLLVLRRPHLTHSRSQPSSCNFLKTVMCYQVGGLSAHAPLPSRSSAQNLMILGGCSSLCLSSTSFELPSFAVNTDTCVGLFYPFCFRFISLILCFA